MAEAEANSLQQCPRCREDAQKFVFFHLKTVGKFRGHLWQAEEGSGSGRKMMISSQARYGKGQQEPWLPPLAPVGFSPFLPNKPQR